MKRRVLSLVLALLMIVTLLPVTTSAATDTAAIRKQITSMYPKIKTNAGVSSLGGLCGLLTSWQIYLLGIDTTLTLHDGRDEYDAYCDLEMTTGGYRVRPYPATEFSLWEALTVITKNGTWDVYNLLVGFQRTNTESGKLHGHSLFIHAIIDGMVYYMEGYDVSVGGHFFSAGQAIVCSISDFCDFYSDSMTFEGIIYFGLDSYTKACQAYPANIYVQAATAVALTEDIPGEDAAYQNPEILHTVAPGEWLHVTNIYETPNGIFYYQITGDTEVGYIPAEAAKLQKICFDDITAEDIEAPGILRKGKPFYLDGTLCSDLNVIDTVLIEVYAEGSDIPVLTLETKQDTYSYSLDNREANRAMAFRTLEEGTYEYRLSVVVANHYVERNRLQTERCTIPVWCSQFQVGGETEGRRSVTFDACGGTVTQNEMVVYAGIPLPTAERAGYTFLGWYTEPEGGTIFTAESSAKIAYAHWGPRTDGYTGWDLVDDVWQYYQDGVLQTGWFTSCGVNYYLNQGSSAVMGWALVNGTAALILGPSGLQMA